MTECDDEVILHCKHMAYVNNAESIVCESNLSINPVKSGKVLLMQISDSVIFAILFFKAFKLMKSVCPRTQNTINYHCSLYHSAVTFSNLIGQRVD